MKKNVNGIEVEMTAKEVTARQAEETAWSDGAFDRAITELRRKRNNLLTETDWMANSDVTMSDDWKTYRQELRDITNGKDTVEKCENATFPTKPGE